MVLHILYLLIRLLRIILSHFYHLIVSFIALVSVFTFNLITV